MAVLFSDIHFHNWSQYSTVTENGRNSRLMHTVAVVEQIKDYCRETAAEHAFLLGDLFHSRTKIDIDVYDAAWNAMKSLATVVELHMLLGNHDSHNRIGDVHSLEPFKEFAHVIDKPCRFDIDVKGDAVRIEAIPWVASREEFAEHAAKVEQCHALLMHQSVIGAELSSGYTKAGEVQLSDIPTTKANYVFMGDYHKPQKLEPNLFYLGSPLQHNFGEAGEEKRFMDWDPRNCAVRSIPTKAPRFWDFKSTDEFNNATEPAPEYDFIRVAYDGDTLDDMARIAEKCPRITAVPKVKETVARSRTDSAVVDSDYELLKEYIQMTAPEEETQEYKDELLVMGMELLNDAVVD